jgi:hypothetical protein
LGVLFKIDSQGNYAVVHDFCAVRLCKDGAEPQNWGGLAIDSAGMIYGTSSGAGGSNGTIFRFDGPIMEVLHRSCAGATCPTGQSPAAGLLQDASGRWFGTMQFGGTYGSGVAFELVP